MKKYRKVYEVSVELKAIRHFRRYFGARAMMRLLNISRATLYRRLAAIRAEDVSTAK